MKDLGGNVELAGYLVGVLWIALVAGLIGWVALRLRARSMRRGNYPFRNLPWYLGGTPEMPLEPPKELRSERRRNR